MWWQFPASLRCLTLTRSRLLRFHGSYHRDVASRIQRSILEGRFAPGGRLPGERALAAEFEVNRTSVREALKTLESIGLVEIKPRSGVYVRTGAGAASPYEAHPPGMALVPNTVLECLEARELIEVGAIGLLKERITQKALDRLHELLTAAQRAESEDEALEFDRQFHIELNMASGNSILAQAATNAFDALWDYYEAIRRIPNRRDTSRHRHAMVLEALRAADFEEAQRQMSTHIGELRAALDLLYRAEP
ncbi:MAG: FadR/GntR family transcriptional regulator [Mycolicibacterium sp.]|uniref:FadR/GntR family transcriptional regulator n=1 Tax=Mycolicibacterium sp. TaxID=2320850 RepID=UPI003D0A6F31